MTPRMAAGSLHLAATAMFRGCTYDAQAAAKFGHETSAGGEFRESR